MSELQPIEPLILTVRGKKVILDSDLAAACGVEIRVLNQAVKRNTDRFFEDFMIQVSADERDSLRSQAVILKKGRGQHRKNLPYAFTEHGAIMAVQGRTGFQPVFDENFYAEKDRLEACPTLGNNYEKKTEADRF